MLLVVNKVLPSINQEALRLQVQKSYNATVAGILPVCDEMFHLASSDIFSLRYPEHPWTQTVSAIAKQLTDRQLATKPFSFR
jgi:MinD-like ATPase involved in chromosome partitioning or flagellar assembly